MSSINTLEPQEKPREKALRNGIDSLSNMELFAILLGHGSKGYSILELSNDLLCKFGSVKGVLSADKNELEKVKGISSATALKIQVVSELYKRCLNSIENNEFNLNNMIKKYCFALDNLENELLMIVGINKNKIVLEKEAFKGNNLNIIFPIKKILKMLIVSSSKKFYLFHNHSYSNLPSENDLRSTYILKKKANDLGIELVEHFIIYKKEAFPILHKS